MVHTGGGGLHLLFAYPSLPEGVQIRNRAGLRPGIDIRGDHGYLVAPPSVHISGQQYAWDVHHHPEDIPLAAPPTWLVELLRQRSPRRTGAVDGRIPEGERHATLCSIAGTMRARGVSREAIRAALLIDNDTRCEPPLDDDEVLDIVDWVAEQPPGYEG